MSTTDVGRRLLFVGGDLSGIQNYLYNITSRKAAVSLKGGSEYLKRKLETVQQRLMQLPSVIPPNPAIENISDGILYNSGGKFYLIVTDCEEARQSIDTFRDRIQEEIWHDLKGLLTVNLNYVPFEYYAVGRVSVDGSPAEDIKQLWRAINEQFAHSKMQKNKHLLLTQFDNFFSPIPVKEKNYVCAVTGVESSDCVSIEGGYRVLPAIKERIEIGEELRERDKFKTFEEYAQGSYLGILRMDIDGLGAAFIDGYKTFGEYRKFSNHLDNFFTEQLPELMKPYKENLNVLYAGGDDMFVVGRWDKVIEFANVVRKAFVKHIQKDKVTLSGGMVIVKPKFPIAKAAELAGDAEDEAKKFRNSEKNAFCMFGQSLSWNGEFDYVDGWRKRMMDLCQTENMPRAILHRIMQLNELRQTKSKDGRENVSYIWQTVYYLTRFGKDKDNARIKSFCDDVLAELVKKEQRIRHYELISVAARWAELQMNPNRSLGMLRLRKGAEF